LSGLDAVPASVTFDRAMDWLGSHRDERFFLLIHTYAAHTPYTHLDFTDGMARGELGEVFGAADLTALQSGRRRLSDVELRYVSALYDGGIAEADRQLGRVLAGLERLGLADATRVVVTSDHGEELGEHYPAHAGDHGHSLRESLLRVPLVWGGPGLSPRRVDMPVRSVDVLPTLLEELGVASPDDLSGRTLTGLLAGRGEPAREVVGGDTKVGPNRRSLRSGGFKLIEQTPGGGRRQMLEPPPPRQLYDLRADPGEGENLVTAQRERADAMSQQLEAMTRDGEAVSSDVDVLPEELREQLRTLGYGE
jgi:arylsulfatase A-like enzyme